MLNFYEQVRDHPELFQQFCCKEILFLNLECPPEFGRGENWGTHNTLLHVLSGIKKISTREQSFELEPGSTLFVKKGGLIVQRLQPGPICLLLFFVPDDFLKKFIRENTSANPASLNYALSSDRLLPVFTNPVMSAFYQSVVSYFSNDTKPPENLLELKFKELLLNIITEENNRELTNYLYNLAFSTSDELQTVMENNCYYNLQLQDYARLCHRSLSSFKRDFLNTFRIPPGRWLIEKRLERAARLLLISQKTILEVVSESGFNDVSNFNRAFKLKYGSSPLQYRKHHSQIPALTA
jgi:AraC-like DNA-binding protein